MKSKLLKSLSNAVAIIIIVFGLLERISLLNTIPPGFGYDEGVNELIYLFNTLSSIHSTSIISLQKLSLYIYQPQVFLLLLIALVNMNVLRKMNIGQFFFVFRLCHAIIGIFVWLIVYLLGKEILGTKNKKLLLIYSTYIAISFPLLITLSRKYTLTTLLMFVLATHLCFKSLHSNNRSLLMTGITLYILSFMIDIKALIYSCISVLYFMLAYFRKVNRVNGKEYTKTGHTLTVVTLISIITCLIAVKAKYPGFLITKLLSSLKLSPSNVILYLHPDYIFITGGLLFLPAKCVPFSRLSCSDAAYMMNAGFGVLGVLGCLLYLMPLLLKRMAISYSPTVRAYVRWFLSLFFAYLISIVLTKYDNPIAVRHVYFYVFYPLTSIIIIKGLAETYLKRIQHKFLIGVLLLLLIYASLFAYQYFYMYRVNVSAKGLNLSSEHELFQTAVRDILNYKFSNISKYHIVLFYISSAPDYRGLNVVLLCKLYTSYLNFKLGKHDTNCIFSNKRYISNIIALRGLIRHILLNTRRQKLLLSFIVENSSGTLQNNILKILKETLEEINKNMSVHVCARKSIYLPLYFVRTRRSVYVLRIDTMLVEISGKSA